MIAFIAYQIYKIWWLRSHGRQIIAVVTSIRHESSVLTQQIYQHQGDLLGKNLVGANAVD